MACEKPIGIDMLIAYWLGELTEVREATLEEHLFGCTYCSQRIEEVAALARGVRGLVKDGKLDLVVVSAPFVQTMRQAGLCLREYRLSPGDSVNCTIRAEDDAVVSRIRAPLAGVQRLDIVNERGGGASDERIVDVPFDAKSGEVIMIPSAAWLKAMPAFTMRTTLIAMSDGSERQIGTYTFNHSPS